MNAKKVEDPEPQAKLLLLVEAYNKMRIVSNQFYGLQHTVNAIERKVGPRLMVSISKRVKLQRAKLDQLSKEMEKKLAEITENARQIRSLFNYFVERCRKYDNLKTLTKYHPGRIYDGKLTDLIFLMGLYPYRTLFPFICFDYRLLFEAEGCRMLFDIAATKQETPSVEKVEIVRVQSKGRIQLLQNLVINQKALIIFNEPPSENSEPPRRIQCELSNTLEVETMAGGRLEIVWFEPDERKHVRNSCKFSTMFQAQQFKAYFSAVLNMLKGRALKIIVEEELRYTPTQAIYYSEGIVINEIRLL